ncbi:MAG: DUF115 domain-containing protein [Lachnospiraceae bacterium]|nr:DUF115 domain-containing protein [Lachnospiraceae bacterium]
MNNYNSNLEILEKRYPTFSSALLEIPTNQVSNISVETIAAKNNSPTLAVIKDENRQYMNSPYNPEREAEHFASQYKDISDFSVFLFYGMGNGIIAREIIKTLPSQCTIIFYEPSEQIFKHVIEEYDISDILSMPNVFIIVNNINSNGVESFFQSAVTEINYKRAYFDSLPKYKFLFPEACNYLQHAFENAVIIRKSSVYTGTVINKTEAENNILNLKYTYSCNCTDQFLDKFPTDLPVVLVAAGPSLEKNGLLLKDVKGKLLIIAVDSALPYLMSNNIIPDLVVAADPIKDLTLFEDERLKDITFAIDSAFTHQGMEKVIGRKPIFIESSNAYYDAVFQIGGQHMYFLENGGSVSTLAFTLALSWGYTKLILIGQDLALGDTKLHAGRETDLSKDTRKRIPIEGYYGDTVYTVSDYKLYLDWYEQMASNNPGLLIINSTEGGALIHGTQNIPFNTIVDEYKDVSFDYEAILHNTEPAICEDKHSVLSSHFVGSITTLESMKSDLNKAISLIDESFTLLNNGLTQNDPNVMLLYKQISSIIDTCGSYNESFFVEKVINDTQSDMLSSLYESGSNPDDEYRQILKTIKDYLTDMASATETVKEMFIKMMDSL